VQTARFACRKESSVRFPRTARRQAGPAGAGSSVLAGRCAGAKGRASSAGLLTGTCEPSSLETCRRAKDLYICKGGKTFGLG